MLAKIKLQIDNQIIKGMYREMTKSYFRWFAVRLMMYTYIGNEIYGILKQAQFFLPTIQVLHIRMLGYLNLATQSNTMRITFLPLTLSLSSLMAMQSTLPAWPRHAWTHSTEFSSLCHSQINMVWSCDPEMNLQVGPPS